MSIRARLGLALLALVLGLSVASSSADLVQKGSLRVSIAGKLEPDRLPREGRKPVAVSIESRFGTTDRSVPPALRKLRIEINRHGRLDTVGVPECRVDQIQPASSAAALKACRDALVGRGGFSVDVVLGSQEPYPSRGRLLVFNGRYEGKPALLGQIYAARPFANSFVIPFQVARREHGGFGITLTATLPAAFTSWGHLTDLRLRLGRRYSYQGRRHSFISANCPAPNGFSQILFPLARTSFSFKNGKTLSNTLSGSCRATG